MSGLGAWVGDRLKSGLVGAYYAWGFLVVLSVSWWFLVVLGSSLLFLLVLGGFDGSRAFFVILGGSWRFLVNFMIFSGF